MECLRGIRAEGWFVRMILVALEGSFSAGFLRIFRVLTTFASFVFVILCSLSFFFSCYVIYLSYGLITIGWYDVLQYHTNLCVLWIFVYFSLLLYESVLVTVVLSSLLYNHVWFFF